MSRGAAAVAPPVMMRARAAALRRLHAAAEGATRIARGIDGTTGKHELSDLTIPSPNRAAGVHFVSTPWAVLRWVHTAALPDADRPAWTFLDLGAGKGRPVLSAAAMSYARVVGVEFAAELVAAARTNVAAAGHAAPRVEIIEGDAARVDLPAGPLLVFMFNPFGPPVFDAVIERLARHRAETNVPVRIAYLNPAHEAVLAADARFRRRPLPSLQALRFRCASPYRLALFDAV